MRILLLRHGMPDYTTDSLTPQGHVEARLLAKRLQNYHIRDIYTSPLGRARQTAEYTLRLRNQQADVLPWLAEFRGRCPDPVTGQDRIPWDFPPRLWTSQPQLLDPEKWVEAPLVAEGTVKQILEETKEGVSELLARYGFQRQGPVWLSEHNTRDTIALFCHFGISAAVLAVLLGCSPVSLWQHSLSVTTSLTEVITEERIPGEVVFRVIRFGDISHLESAGVARSTAGLYPECYTGVDSTDPRNNLELPWVL